MVKYAALRTDSPLETESSIALESLPLWRDRTLRWQRRCLDRAFSAFTFVADVTTLARDCRFAGDGHTLVARYDGLPFAAIAFCIQDGMHEDGAISRRVVTLTRRLMAPGEAFTCLVAEIEWPLVQAAYHVLQTYPEWQMSFCADPLMLDAGQAVPLGPSSLPEMRALAQREGMQAFERNPLSRGIWYGVWRSGRLVAQGGTHLLLERAAEIGNIVTARAYRRR